MDPRQLDALARLVQAGIVRHGSPQWCTLMEQAMGWPEGTLGG